MNKKTITKALAFSLSVSALTTILLASYDTIINHLSANGIKSLIYFIIVFYRV